MSLTTRVKAILTAGSVTAIYIGSQPATPANCVTIYATGGFPRSLTESKVEQPTFQIRVRNASYATGEALCGTIDDLLHAHSDANLQLIRNMGGINDIGRDANSNAEFTLNYQTIYKK